MVSSVRVIKASRVMAPASLRESSKSSQWRSVGTPISLNSGNPLGCLSPDAGHLPFGKTAQPRGLLKKFPRAHWPSPRQTERVRSSGTGSGQPAWDAHRSPQNSPKEKIRPLWVLILSGGEHGPFRLASHKTQLPEQLAPRRERPSKISIGRRESP